MPEAKSGRSTRPVPGLPCTLVGRGHGHAAAVAVRESPPESARRAGLGPQDCCPMWLSAPSQHASACTRHHPPARRGENTREGERKSATRRDAAKERERERKREHYNTAQHRATKSESHAGRQLLASQHVAPRRAHPPRRKQGRERAVSRSQRRRSTTTQQTPLTVPATQPTHAPGTQHDKQVFGEVRPF